MKRLKETMTLLSLLAMLGGCTVGAPRQYMMAPDTANYTDKYIDYTLNDIEGRNLGLGGEAKPFIRGGTGGIQCCVTLPGPGQPLRIVWSEETEDDELSKKRTYTQDVVVSGSQPLPGEPHNYLIVRFFPKQQLEVEFVSEPVSGPRSPRRDRILFGDHVMRRVGE